LKAIHPMFDLISILAGTHFPLCNKTREGRSGKSMVNKAGEYLSRAGTFALGAVRESVKRHDEEVVSESQDNGIRITTAALYEAKVKVEPYQFIGVRREDSYACIIGVSEP
jgi:hypothetical protein